MLVTPCSAVIWSTARRRLPPMVGGASKIALCSLMTRRVSERHLIQAIRRPAPETLARSRYRAERPSGTCGLSDAGLGNAPG